MLARRAVHCFARCLKQTRWSSTLPFVGERKTSAFSVLDPNEIKLASAIRLRGRRFLPGAEAETFPEYLNGPREHFPLALEAEGTYDIEEWGKLCREEADAGLIAHGAILFRGLPIETTDDFQQLFHSVGYPPMNYIGGSGHREHVSSQVYSASDEPQECCIDLHNELSYCPVYNKKVSSAVIRSCLVPPMHSFLILEVGSFLSLILANCPAIFKSHCKPENNGIDFVCHRESPPARHDFMHIALAVV